MSTLTNFSSVFDSNRLLGAIDFNEDLVVVAVIKHFQQNLSTWFLSAALSRMNKNIRIATEITIIIVILPIHSGRRTNRLIRRTILWRENPSGILKEVNV